MSQSKEKMLRLILGDQLNYTHSWFREVRDDVVYVLMEIRSETDYVKHHVQKVLGIFAAMRAFTQMLRENGHTVVYLTLDHPDNLQTIADNCRRFIEQTNANKFEYLLPDECRVDEHLKSFCAYLSIPFQSYDSEHFFTTRTTFSEIFQGTNNYLMERFYRTMRKKHNILMNGKEPVSGQWNHDASNRKKIPKNHVILEPFLFKNDVSEIYEMLIKKEVSTIGTVAPKEFLWPIDRKQSLALLDYFVSECLPNFGTYEDAMTMHSWSLYHSRLSFSMNLKLLSPKEVIDKAVQSWQENQERITFNQIEGFVRQILGWREFMRGIYWKHMPEFGQLNFFNHRTALPRWFWTGETHMNCLKQCISQSLEKAYAHHIQRLMITGNFALLAGIDPDALDEWYLGIYIDAFEWVEITNTRGMSQFADGGIVGSKPYVSSAAYIDKMSDYCSNCRYDKSLKTGDNACPFNSLYWHFYARNTAKLSNNPRIGMMYNVWNKMEATTKDAILQQAEHYLQNLENL